MPPRSGRRTDLPGDRPVAWYDLPDARQRLEQAQVPFLDRLAAALGLPEAPPGDDQPASPPLPG
jgi:predicted NUDIX family NTP pyrophosphohydrolase